MFWGDPHIQSFDGARPSFYGDGEFWIVKSQRVKIQGRYMGTDYTDGLAATNKVAVGGDFLQGHIIEVANLDDGGILVDGEAVLQELGSSYSVAGLATLTYDSLGALPDEAQSKYTKRIVHMELPDGVTFTVYRWQNYLDLKLEMDPVEGGQDGSCGNFNGDPTDDTTEAIFHRIGARVGPGDMLLRHRADIKFTPEMEQMLSTCPGDQLVQGELECRQELPQTASSIEVNSCVFDFCFGMNEHALKIAQTFE